MTASFLNNIPWGTLSLVFIVLGTIFGGYGAYLDNRTITELLEQNKTWAQTMDDKVDDNSETNRKILEISDNVRNIATENKQILDDNISMNTDIENIVTDIKKVSSRTEDISNNTAKMIENINLNSEAIKFFNGVNFSYLQDVAFPEGFTVFRQNKNSDSFKKVYGEKLFYEQFDMKIVETSPGEFSAEMYNIRILPHQSNTIQISGEKARIKHDKFDPSNYKTLQLFNPIQLVPNMVTAILMINDGHEYTFAVGFTPYDRDLYEKTH